MPVPSRLLQMSNWKQFGDEYATDHNGDLLGRGSFGEVRIGSTSTGRQVAVKIATEKSKIDAAKKEIEFLMRFLEDEHIVKLIGSQYYEDKNGQHPPNLSFAMEMADCSLDKLMREGPNIRGLEQNVLTDLVMDCYSAMKSLRREKIAHRDVKHLNILVFRSKQRSRKSTYLFKFCDFGNGMEVKDDFGMNSLVGTPNFLHPKLSKELAKGAFKKWKVSENYSADEVDLWPLACTLFFAANGSYPFPYHHQDPNIYNLAVSTCPPDCISAKIVNGPDNVQFDFQKEIENQRYPKWFRVAFSTLIRALIHNPSMQTYKKIANALVTSQEYTFLSLPQLDVVKYADVTSEPLLSDGHPTVRSVLGIPEQLECRLFGEEDDIRWLNQHNLLRLNAKSSYLVLPAGEQFVMDPKQWKLKAQPERFENHKSQEEFLNTRFSYIGDGFLALHHADTLFTLFDSGKNIIQQHFKRLRMQIISVKDSSAYPLRFATYSSCQCQAWFIQSEEDRNTAAEGMRLSAEQTKELTQYSKELDQLVSEVDKSLEWLKGLQLDERELPGVEAELIRYAFCEQLATGKYIDAVRKSAVFTQGLVQRCYDRRTHMASEFCGKTGQESQKDIRTNMLQALSQIMTMDNKLRELRNSVEKCAIHLELPFQAMKQRVEQANSQSNITERDIRRSLSFHSGPNRVSTSAAELQELAKILQQTLNASSKR